MFARGHNVRDSFFLLWQVVRVPGGQFLSDQRLSGQDFIMRFQFFRNYLREGIMNSEIRNLGNFGMKKLKFF
jgi:hypothetical protein